MESSILLWEMLSLNFKKKCLALGKKTKKNTLFFFIFSHFFFSLPRAVRFNDFYNDDKKMKHKTAHDKQTPPYHFQIVQCLEHIYR